MFDLIKSMFSSEPAVDVKEWKSRGAIILDVRTKGEYQDGHIKGSVNIPLQSLESGLSKLDKSKPIITCCASGMRSESAKQILKSAGFTEVYNGGGWYGLQSKLK